MMQIEYRTKREYVALGKALAALRCAKGLSQREVSVRLGYSSGQFISNFERGIAAPPLEKLRVLVKLYGVRAEDILEILLDCQRVSMLAQLRGPRQR